MNKGTLPRWGWLLLGLFAAAMLANAVNVAVLARLGLSEEYYVITVITAMAPVLIYVGIWHDDDRSDYWDHATARIVGDLLFVLSGAAIGSAIVLVGLGDVGLPSIVTEIAAMGGGFVLGWGLFWWRNPEMYLQDDGR